MILLEEVRLSYTVDRARLDLCAATLADALACAARLQLRDPDASPDADAVSAIDAPAPRAGRARTGKAWTEEEEARLRDAFSAGVEVVTVAGELGRSPGAVRARLVRLGLMTAEEAGLRYPIAPTAAPPAAPVPPSA